MKPIEEMTPEEMDAWLANAWGTLKTAELDAYANVVYRAGEFIRELGRRLQSGITNNQG